MRIGFLELVAGGGASAKALAMMTKLHPPNPLEELNWETHALGPARA